MMLKLKYTYKYPGELIEELRAFARSYTAWEFEVARKDQAQARNTYIMMNGHRILVSRELAIGALGDLLDPRERFSRDEQLLRRRRVVNVHELAVLVPLVEVAALVTQHRLPVALSAVGDARGSEQKQQQSGA